MEQLIQNCATQNHLKNIHLYNIVELGSTISALTYSVPEDLRKIHAYHPDV